MTFQSRSARLLSAIALTVLAAAPLTAGVQRTRAVLHPKNEKINISGTVTDAGTGAPLKGASVSAGGDVVQTDDAGHYSLTCGANASVVASRPGYVTQEKAANGPVINFALQQTQSVTVKLTNGQTIVLDFPSTKFGLGYGFQYNTSDGVSLCRTGEAKWEKVKSEFQKIIGPAHPVSASACCDRGPVMAIDVQMKDGTNTTAYLNDSCFGYDVDIVGIERSTATAKYLHLKDVAEVTFP